MKDNATYLGHIQECILRVQEYTKDGESFFHSNSMVQDAVIRNLITIGEATKNIDDSFKGDHKDVPWRQMAGARDRIIHDYIGVDMDLVWSIVEKELPVLKEQVEKMMVDLGGEP